MGNDIIIKSNKYGLTIYLNPDFAFDEIKNKIYEKFSKFQNFFKGQEIAICFDGKKLTNEEQVILINEIEQNANIKIAYIIDNDTEKENLMKEIIKRKIPDPVNENNECKFYKGTLRSGQTLESSSSVVVLGDVNPGATVMTNGNIIILGTLKGTACSGTNGNENTFVAALSMDPMQIQIGNYIARSADISKGKRKISDKPMIAYVDNENIYIEEITKDVIADIKI